MDLADLRAGRQPGLVPIRALDLRRVEEHASRFLRGRAVVQLSIQWQTQHVFRQGYDGMRRQKNQLGAAWRLGISFTVASAFSPGHAVAAGIDFNALANAVKNAQDALKAAKDLANGKPLDAASTSASSPPQGVGAPGLQNADTTPTGNVVVRYQGASLAEPYQDAARRVTTNPI